MKYTRSINLSYDEVKDTILSGVSIEELAVNMGVSYGGVAKRLREDYPDTYKQLLDLNSKLKNEKKLESRIMSIGKDIDELVREGYSFKKIYNEFGIPIQLTKRYFKENHPGAYHLLVKNGKINKESNRKLHEEELKLALSMSEAGFGIEAIGKEFGVDGTTIRYNLIKLLGKDKYKLRHSISRYKDNNGWNGKSIEYNGDTYQSYAEVRIAKCLNAHGIPFKPHPFIKVRGNRYYPDFYLPHIDTCIEYAGMLNVSFYRKKFAQKITDYSLGNIKFIVIVPETLTKFEDSDVKELMPNVAANL